MQCPTFCHVMAWCHEEKRILYFKCNHGTCNAAGMKCKFCNVIKLSKKGCTKNIKYIMLKHYKQEHLSSAYNTGTAVKSVQLMIECNSTISTKSHSNSESNEPSTIVSSLTSVDSSAITYQYHHFHHLDSPPNQHSKEKVDIQLYPAFFCSHTALIPDFHIYQFVYQNFQF